MSDETDLLPDQVIKNIKTVIGIQAEQTKKEACHVRVLQKIGNLMGTAAFLWEKRGLIYQSSLKRLRMNTMVMVYSEVKLL